jgi:foldase protein PrsA
VTGLSASRKRQVGLALLLALAIAVLVVALTSGLGRSGVPSGAVAIVDGVDDGTISNEDYERALDQTAARLGLEQAPAPGTPEFEQANDETMQGLLLAIWAQGEIDDRGLEVTDASVQDELTQIEDSFQNEREFRRTVRDARFCTEEELAAETPPAECEDVIGQARLIALQRKLTEAFTTEPEVTDADVERFYESNAETFQTPATRSVRVILNEDEAEVEAAREQLDGLSPDDESYAKAWRQAAAEFSQDQASEDRGGLLEGLVEGQGDPQLDEQVFSATAGELVGPVETDRGFYLIQVVDETEPTTQSLEQADPNIRQQLVAARQQTQQADVQSRFVAKWTRLTVCDSSVEMVFCSNFVAPEPEPVQGQEAVEAPAVVSNSPIEPGTATFSADGLTQTGLPQGPSGLEGDPAAAADGQLPPGAVPVGPDGAPATPTP